MSSSVATSRRTPLAVNANAANSPMRASANAAATGSGSASINSSNSNSNSLTAALYAKQQQQRRSHASMQREENYGQGHPAKKQMLEKTEHHASATVTTARVSGIRSPTLTRRVRVSQQHAQHAQHAQQTQQTQQQPQGGHARRQEYQKISEREAEEVRRWQQSQRLRFPKLVFYFDNVPGDQSARLTKQLNHLGASEDKFFSINITHVVTTRPIPPEEKPAAKQPAPKEGGAVRGPDNGHEQVQTINPSLLSRSQVNEFGITTTSLPVKRKLFDTAPSRRMPLAPFGNVDDVMRKSKPARSTDILHRARDMGKKIWSLEKLQKVLDMLLEPDPYRSAELGQRVRNSAAHGGAAGHASNTRFAGDQALLQMLDKERHTGPSDRDPTVAARELTYFKGYYIYVYDIEEKQRPIMVREYAKVADREEGDWPQLRASGETRCPFVEATDQVELRAERKRAKMRPAAVAAVAATATAAQAASKTTDAYMHKLASKHASHTHASHTHANGHGSVAAKQPVTGKRSLAEMEDGHNRQAANGNALAGAPSLRPAEGVHGGSNGAASAGSLSSVASAAPPSKARTGSLDYQSQNAFTSRAKSGRYFYGEPVASGMQAAGITSAIRSQAISSATGTLGVRAATSKEIHGLQRKVLQKTTTAMATSTSQHLTDAATVDQTANGQSQQRHGHGYSRSTSLATTTTMCQPTPAGDGSTASVDERKRARTGSAGSVAPAVRPKRRDPKPGYCENCQDKFDDFEVHISSHKHRKFAEDARNWTDLDELLGQLSRQSKYGFEQWQ